MLYQMNFYMYGEGDSVLLMYPTSQNKIQSILKFSSNRRRRLMKYKWNWKQFINRLWPPFEGSLLRQSIDYMA